MQPNGVPVTVACAGVEEIHIFVSGDKHPRSKVNNVNLIALP